MIRDLYRSRMNKFRFIIYSNLLSIFYTLILEKNFVSHIIIIICTIGATVLLLQQGRQYIYIVFIFPDASLLP